MEKMQLQAHTITKQYLQGNEVIRVLQGVSATFQQGTTYAITGVSGAGKSTLLHILAGLDTPTQGRVTINGTDLATLHHEQRAAFLNDTVGLVFQQPYLLNELSVIENLMLKGMMRGMPRDVCHDKAYNLLTMVGLAAKVDSKPAQLSGGQQQRVAIVRALFNEPAFLLADEPTGNLDEATGKEVVDFLFECHAQWHMGMIVSSHDPYIARRMNEVLKLHDGKLV